MKSNRNQLPLFAIYKNGKHKGNERAKNTDTAIKYYIIASDLPQYLIKDKSFLKKYSALVAIKGTHFE